MLAHTAARPGADEYPAYFEGYVSLVPTGNVLHTLGRQIDDTLAALRGVTEERAGTSYAPGKWTVKQLAGHVADSERVFAYRVLCIARGDTAPLPGMDQNVYVEHANFDARALASLADELKHVRASTLDLLTHLDEPAWLRRGTANESRMSVRALAHIIAGHEAHHLNVLRERYLEEQG
jgi:uncharacterized damage-inducible protein DinB